MSGYTKIKQVYDLFDPYPHLKKEVSSETTQALNSFLKLIKNHHELEAEWNNILLDIKENTKPQQGINNHIQEWFNKHTDCYIAIENILSTIKLPIKAVQPITITSPITVTTAKSLINLAPIAIASISTAPVNRFQNWRSDEKPIFKRPNPIRVPLDEINCPKQNRAQIEKHCLQKYQQAIRLMEHSMAEVALQYTHLNPPIEGMGELFTDKFRTNDNIGSTEKPGVLLHFVNAYSQRYLDLYDAYMAWELQKGIPMLPVDAGQMKLHGFVSEEIIEMQAASKTYSTIVAEIINILGDDPLNEKYNKIIAAMTNMDKDINLDTFINDPGKRETFLEFIDVAHRKNVADALAIQFSEYNSIPEKERKLIDKAHFLMHDFGHLEYPDIAMQLYYVSIMKTDPDASTEERKQMEIRHRIAGDMSIHQNSPGSLGGNPLAYLNMLKMGEKDNPEAEFRNKMYFVYMNNHFANAVIRDQERIDFINTWLRTNNKGWQLDQDFIDEMNKRPASYIPPIFRYGANAALNRQLREIRSHEEVAEFYKANANTTIREVMEDISGINAYYRKKLSARELMNQIGEWIWNQQDKNRPWQSVNFGTGAAVFKLYERPTSSMNDSAKAYLSQVNDFNLPVYAGISGTLDQSTAMAGLVGLGIDEDFKRRELELQTIKMAYLAFMLPGRDHSVHEIMQSSMTYGLDYVPGPGYEKYVYPADPYVIKELEHQQFLRGSHLPSYYLTKTYTQHALKTLQESGSLELVDDVVATPSNANSHFNHYVGISVVGTQLEEAIAAWRQENPGMHWIPPANLHITIGWLDTALTTAQQENIAKLLSPILARYDNLFFSITGVEMWDKGKDVTITLKENSKQFEKIRQEIQEVFSSNGLHFEFDSRLHMVIGHTDAVTETSSVQQSFGKPPQRSFEFSHCGLMHSSPQDRWRLQTDREFPFKALSEDMHRTIETLDAQFKENKKKAKERDNIKKVQSEKALQEKLISGVDDQKRVGAFTSFKKQHRNSHPGTSQNAAPIHEQSTPKEGSGRQPKK